MQLSFAVRSESQSVATEVRDDIVAWMAEHTTDDCEELNDDVEDMVCGESIWVADHCLTFRGEYERGTKLLSPEIH
jgi:hypothetical protein